MNGKVFLEPRRSFPFIETNNVKADCKRKVRIVYSSFPERQAAVNNMSWSVATYSRQPHQMRILDSQAGYSQLIDNSSR